MVKNVQKIEYEQITQKKGSLFQRAFHKSKSLIV
jgi:hypothetical protein